MTESLLWVGEYRPQTINDCILPLNVSSLLLDLVEQVKIPNQFRKWQRKTCVLIPIALVTQ